MFNGECIRNLEHTNVFANLKMKENVASTLIYYYVVNLPVSLTKNKTLFIHTLNEMDDLEVYSKEFIQVIIDFKWIAYTKRFF